MRSLLDHFGHMRVTLGPFWDDFAVTLGSLLAYEGDFGSILGSLCGHFGINFGHMRVTLGPFWSHFGAALGI